MGNVEGCPGSICIESACGTLVSNSFLCPHNFQISCDFSCPIKLLLMYIGDVIANYYLDMFLIIFSLEITISRSIQAEGHL